MVLKLTLKKIWFDLIFAGFKREEYREIKPYWFNRIMEHYGDGLEDTVERICKAYQNPKKFGYASIFDINEFNEIAPKGYKYIHFFNGGHFSNKLPQFKIELLNIDIRKGVKVWGADPDKIYFVFELGKITDVKNCNL